MTAQLPTPRALALIAGFSCATAGALVWLPYQTFRGMSEHFGFDGVHFLEACMFPLLLLLPVALMIAAAVAQAYHMRQERWLAAERGACIRCGYDLRHGERGERFGVCPECGTERSAVPRLHRWYAPRLLAAVLGGMAAGVLLASVCGELRILRDESRFRREAAAFVAGGGTGMFSRQRAWPNGDCSLIFEASRAHLPGGGFRATE